jgi:beta-glucosidase
MTLEQKVRQMQNSAPAIPDLQVPAYDWWNEALHGVARAGRATVFPQAIGLAAAWDTDLMFRVADVISTEARAKYHDAIRRDNRGRYYGLTFWSPNINIFRDPRWGRGQETYGEDPFLTGRLAVSFIKGLQGDNPVYFKVIATAKHYAVHSGPESTRHSVDVAPSVEDLERTYLPAFRAAIMDGHAGSVMCAYNRVNGMPACASTDLLQARLKRDWGFDGYVVSDCGAIRDIYAETAHHYLPTAGEASAAAGKAGTDLTCGGEYASLAGAVQAGRIAEAEIDRSLVRLFSARFKLGMFDPPERVPYAKIPYSEVDSPAHRALALEAARKSIVLLKNDRQTLPLRPTVHRIAVIGPSADDPVARWAIQRVSLQRHAV